MLMQPHAVAIISGIFALLGVFGGSYLQGQFQEKLWRAEARYKFVTDYWNKRIEAYRQLSGVLADAQRIGIYHGVRNAKDVPSIVDILFCAKPENRSEACKINLADKDTASLAKEVFELHGRFEAARVTANIYFCDKTRDALKKLPAGVWWWNATSESKDNLFQAMEAEMTCELDQVLKTK